MQPTGSKLWRMKYHFRGKEKLLSFGKFPAVTLAMARMKLNDTKALIDAGCDPAETRRGAKRLAASPDFFEPVALAWHANRVDGFSPAHADRVLSRLERDVFPVLGKRPIRYIAVPGVLDVIRTVEACGALDNSRRLKQNIGQMFRFAIASG